ncbi:MAG: hypothetical protein COB60_01670 [Flavobacteriaceae bacterium]|nr:MAG: hypothetical protein COB60_01670 [Flavobacteriaceae bacterium]
MKLIISYILIGCLLCTSCTTENTTYPVGEGFIDHDISIKIIDTLSINSSTFLLDSLVTSSTNRILIGHIKDNNLGDMTSKSFLSLMSNSYSLQSNAIFDSVALVLYNDHYYDGDTTKIQTYSVHKVSKLITPEEGSYLYNNSNFPYDENALGTLTFTPNPTKNDSLYIPLNQYFGQFLFDKIQDNDIKNSNDMEDYLKGLVVIPSTAQNSQILGFTTNSQSGMRIYYTIKDDDSEDNNYQIDFSIGVSNQQFNQVLSDRSNTNFNVLKDNETNIPSSETANFIAIQGGTGLSGRLEIPYLKNLLKLSENGISLNGVIKMQPVKGSFTKQNPLPDSLSVYIVDHKNRVLDNLRDQGGNAIYATLNQNENEFNDATYYKVDISAFIETIINSPITLKYALMFQLHDYQKNTSKVLIENDPESVSKIKIQVQYLNY